jgi:hypothetical protein
MFMHPPRTTSRRQVLRRIGMAGLGTALAPPALRAQDATAETFEAAITPGVVYGEAGQRRAGHPRCQARTNHH